MSTKTDAVKSSVKKWKGIVAILERGRYVQTRGSCGFCEFHGMHGFAESSCCGCPLFPDTCRGNHGAGKSLFWRITDLVDRCHVDGTLPPEALPLAKEMLEAIKTLGAKWIKVKSKAE